METDKKKKRKRILLWGFRLTAVGVLGYFGWKAYKQRKQNRAEDLPEIPVPSFLTTSSGNSGSSQSRSDNFPLKKGSRGDRVRQLQEALISKYGKSIMPKYGADGDFGTETINALKSKGLPETIDETTFNLLVKSRSFDAKALAKTIYQYATARNASQVINALKQMKTREDYSAVSENFIALRFGGVRQTLVTALMKTFIGSAKEQIQMEFVRMGLKYDGDKWTLSGINDLKLITNRPAIIWINRKTAIKVPARTILGFKQGEKNGYILFRSIHNQNFLVSATSVNYL